MSEKPLKGCYFQTAHGRVSFEIDANSDLLFKLADVLSSQFGFEAVGAPLDGVDVIYWDFSCEGSKLTLGWDIWSGCFIFGNTQEDDEIVRSIGHYLEAVLHEL